MKITNPKVEVYFRTVKRWQKDMTKLRLIVLDCQLKEDLKWGKPCYSFGDSNIVILQDFKEYCALMFFKGALLKDAEGILIKPGENTQSSRQIRFTHVREIVAQKAVLKAYIEEALEVEKAGLKVKLRKTTEFPIAEEFQNKLAAVPGLKTAFDGLTPGRQRAYLLYFSAAKQAKTRESRVAKCVQQILEGKGLDD